MIIKFTAIPIITRGNPIFPDKILIDTDAKSITFHKRNSYILGYKKMTIHKQHISSVSIHLNSEMLYFSNIQIESYGGKMINVSGFTPKNAREIKFLIESL